MLFAIRLRSFLAVATGLAVLCASGPAAAAWHRAETARFVVYGEGREAKVRAYAVKLQTFDAVLRVFHPSTKDIPPAAKVHVYLVDGTRDLRRIRPGLGSLVAGFYAASNEGLIAAVATEGTLDDDDVLFHEYAHHFMLENFPAAYPAWFVEGFAEYFMTAEVDNDGVTVGGFNEARAVSIFLETWLPWEDVFAKAPATLKRSEVNVYYSQAWLLSHYMYSDPARARQLDQMIRAIAAGAQPATAFREATGMTPAELTRALRAYRKLSRFLVKPSGGAPAVTVTRLTPGEEAFVLDHPRLLLSAPGEQDAPYLDSIRRRAKAFPGDPFAQRTLARAEFIMGDVAAGEAIMAAQAAALPNDLETQLLMGMGQVLAGMRDGDSRNTRFRAARAPLTKAYGLDKGDFRALYAYTVARSIEPGYPTDNDLTVMLEARGLAPSVQELSLRAGLALLHKNRTADARNVLAPVVNNPHGGAYAAQARALLAGKSEAEAEAAGRAAEEIPAAPSPSTPADPAKPAPPTEPAAR